MNMISVSPSAIAAIGYHGGTLFVQFHTSDKIYSHLGVPESVFHGLMNASSLGAYYNRYIRGRYR